MSHSRQQLVRYGSGRQHLRPRDHPEPRHRSGERADGFFDAKSRRGEKINDVRHRQGDRPGQRRPAVDELITRAGHGRLRGTAWIEKDGDHNLVQASIQQSTGNSIQMTLSDWNKPVTVTKPQV